MNTPIHFGFGDTSLGLVLAATSNHGVCSILIGDDPVTLTRDLRRRLGAARLVRDDAKVRLALEKVSAFIDSPGAGLDLTLDLTGTEFQRRVWRALTRIPAGSTASYADIARRIDAPKSFRAVAQACAANPIALAIPCHRVVRSDGALSGYRWGAARKRALLEREARA
jgi:AraC family transcriptional regulator, regulatory protein of adaptative response / methylated-DNA-[protein]-cysteine methyltransferase